MRVSKVVLQIVFIEGTVKILIHLLFDFIEWAALKYLHEF